MAVSVALLRSKQTRTSGGARDSHLAAVAAVPTGSPPGSTPRTYTTPAAKGPQAPRPPARWRPRPCPPRGGRAARQPGRRRGGARAASCSNAGIQPELSPKGVRTVATAPPASPPWFIGNKPANGQGYESAVAFAVAKQLGFTPSQVNW